MTVPRKLAAMVMRQYTCPKCQRPTQLVHIGGGCLHGRCDPCGLTIKGSIGQEGALDEGYITTVTFPTDYSPDGIGHVEDDPPGRRWAPQHMRPQIKARPPDNKRLMP